MPHRASTNHILGHPNTQGWQDIIKWAQESHFPVDHLALAPIICFFGGTFRPNRCDKTLPSQSSTN